MPYFVYILQSLKDFKYYIGTTSNLNSRLDFHNKGLQRSTKSRIPFKIVYSEEHPNKKSALLREKQIKSYKGGNAFYKLIVERGVPL